MNLEGYVEARGFASKLCDEIFGSIKVGMTEKEVEDSAHEVFKKHEVRQHWHMPIIGVGKGSTKLRSVYALASSYLTRGRRIVKQNDLILIDIAPIYNGYPSDYTACYIFGSNPELEALINYAQEISKKIAKYISSAMTIEEVFRYGEKLVSASGYKLALPPVINMGHRICRLPYLWQNLPEPGLSYLILKKGSFITSTSKELVQGLWMIEPYLIYKERASKFETLVLVGEETEIID